MTTDRFLDLAPLDALGVLDGEDLRDFRLHLDAGCAECEAALAEARESLLPLARALPPVEPSPALKARIMDALPPRLGVVQGGIRRDTSPNPLPLTRGDQEPSPARVFALPRWAGWSLAAAAVAVIGLSSALYMQSQRRPAVVAVGTDTQGTADSLRAMQGEVAALEGKVGALSDSLTQQESTEHQLRGMLGSYSSRVAALNTQYTTAVASLNQAQGALRRVSDQRDQYAASDKQHETEVAGLRAREAEALAQVARVRGDFSEQARTLDDLNALLAAPGTLLGALKSNGAEGAQFASADVHALWNPSLGKAFLAGSSFPVPQAVSDSFLVVWTIEEQNKQTAVHNRGSFTLRQARVGVASAPSIKGAGSIKGFAFSLESSASVNAPSKIVMIPGGAPVTLPGIKTATR